nr:myosin-5 [Quercus suber]
MLFIQQWGILEGHDATEEFVGLAWDEMKHIRQAVGFLVIHQKPKKTLKEITNDLCPVLSIQQLYRISTMYWDDKYGTHSVSTDVVFISGFSVPRWLHFMLQNHNRSVLSRQVMSDEAWNAEYSSCELIHNLLCSTYHQSAAVAQAIAISNNCLSEPHAPTGATIDFAILQFAVLHVLLNTSLNNTLSSHIIFIHVNTYPYI